MLDKVIAKQSLSYSGLVVLYVAVVATIMQNGSKIFGEGDTFVPIGILMLLVVSAATVGLLIFGKPVMMYIDGKKKEAVTLVIYIIADLAAATALLFVIMAFINSSTLTR